MKKLVLLLTLLMIVVSCFSFASADYLDFSPWLQVEEDGTLIVTDVNDDTKFTSLEITGGRLSTLYFPEIDYLIAFSYYDNKTVRFTLDGTQMGTDLASLDYTTLIFEPGLYLYSGRENQGNTVTYKFEKLSDKELLKITTNPEKLTQKSTGSFRVSVTGQNDLKFRIDYGNLDDVIKVLYGYYTIAGEVVPIEIGDSGTANVDRENNKLELVANANGLKLLNQLPDGPDYYVHVAFNPCLGKTSRIEFTDKNGDEHDYNMFVFGQVHTSFGVDRSGNVPVPTSAPQGNVPATGDSMPVALFAVLALLALCGVAAMIIRSRKA